MHIKRITIEGFKTYKEVTPTPEFSERHNVILGKNGSGKSNVFAAVEFVLGTDKYATLRPEEKQQLLHEGSGPDVVQASVEIVFDNADMRFPVDLPEVTIKRIIGVRKDEFLVNSRHVTKQETYNLLESAGISRANPFFIVKQGKVNSIIKMRDEQRLDLLKEIAGTRAYDDRKRESLKIMQQTDSRMRTITDTLETIETRLAELAEEKQELDEFQRLDTTRRCLEFTVYDKELRAAQARLDALEETRAESAEKSGGLHGGAAEAREALQLAEEEARQLREALAASRARLGVLQAERKRELVSLSRAELRARDADARREQERARLAKAEEELKVVLEQVERCQADLAAAAAELAARVADEEAAAARRQRNESRLQELYARQGRSAQFGTRAERDAFLARELESVRASAAAEEAQAAETLRGVEALRAEADSRRRAARRSAARLADLRAQMAASDSRVAELRARRDEANDLRKETWRREASLEKEFAATQARLDRAERTLQQTMDKSVYHGLEAVKRLVREHKIEGYYGPLISLFECDPKFDVAVETTAGGALFHVVVDTDETAARIIELLAREKAGRVTFVPLSRVRPPEAHFPPTKEAFPIISKLRYDPRHQRAVQQVFGRTMVARTLAVAAEIARAEGLDAILLDGDKVSRKGALTGGYVDSRRSRLEAQRSIGGLRAEHERLRAELDAAQRDKRQHDQAVTRYMGELQKEGASKAHVRNQLEQLHSEQAAAERLNAADAEAAELGERRHRAALAAARQLAERAEALEREMAGDLGDGLSAAEQEELHALNEEATELKTAVPAAQQARAEAEARRRSLAQRLSENLCRRREELQQRAEGLRGGDAGDEVDRDRREAQDLRHQADELQGEIAALEKEGDGQRARLATVEARLEELKERERASEEALAREAKAAERLMNKRSILVAKQRDCVKKIRDLGSLPSGYEQHRAKSVPQLMKELEKCSARLARFTHVNKKAVDQFVSYTRQREDFQGRRRETEQGRTAILDLVRHLDMKKDNDIQLTFKTIAKHFSAVFSELVPEGKATLVIHTRRPQEQADGDDGEAEEPQEGHDLEVGNEEEEREEEEEEEEEREEEEEEEEEEDDDDDGDDDDSEESNPNARGRRRSRPKDATPEKAVVPRRKKKKRNSGAAVPSVPPAAGLSTAFYTGVGVKVSFSGQEGGAQLMHQLSGGQQSVVALALIFAIQRADPSPFYLFDEIDSALDAVHRTSVAKMIEREANREEGGAQFITTTFRPEMLKSANRFYHVTFVNKVSRIELVGRDEADYFMHQVEKELENEQQQAAGEAASSRRRSRPRA